MKRAKLAMFMGFLLAGCSTTQVLVISTDPPGADVSLTTYGINEGSADLPGGVSMAGTGDTFEDGPFRLGTSPIRYEFDLVEETTHMAIELMGVSTRKRIEEGLIRAEKNGTYAEARVKFKGDELILHLDLAGSAAADATGVSEMDSAQ